MVRRRGEVTMRQVRRDWPVHVVIPAPELGHRQRMSAIFARAAGLNGRYGGEGRWCFRSESAAAAFRAWFDGGEASP
jgi:hypothetical protein